MNLFTALPDRWYERINQATRSLSLVILIAFIVFEYFWKPLGGNAFFGFTLPVAILAFIHLIVSTIVFRRLSINKAMLAGILSFSVFTIMTAVMIHTTRDLGTQYIGFWTIVLLFAGMFGSLMLIVTTGIALAYLILIQMGFVNAPVDFNEAVILLNLLTAGVSHTLWRSVKKEPLPTEKISGTEISSELLRSKVNSSVLIESIVDGVALIDSEGVIQVFNPAAQEITGWQASEALELDYHSIIKLQDSKGNPFLSEQDPVARCFSVGEPIKENSAFLQSGSNKAVEVEIIVSPIKEKGGSIPAVMVVFRDVSKQRNEERQRAEFISTASHEMRTPVAAIEGYLSLALNEKIAKIDTNAKNYLEKAQASTRHLGKLFQDLLTAAKSEDGRLTNHPVVVEVGKFLREITEGVRFTAEKKGMLVEFNISGNQIKTTSESKGQVVEPIYYIHVDPDRMREVITNLFDNAVKYSEEGKITIGMGEDGGNVLISVKDEGHGIPKEDIPHLFQKFYRVDNTATRQVGGTGLGLFISKKVVELYNGRIWAESEVGHGSDFKISLPRLSAQKAQELLKMEAANQTPIDDTESISSKIDDFAGATPTPVQSQPGEKDKETPPDPAPATKTPVIAAVAPDPVPAPITEIAQTPAAPVPAPAANQVPVAAPQVIDPAAAAQNLIQQAVSNQAQMPVAPAQSLTPATPVQPVAPAASNPLPVAISEINQPAVAPNTQVQVQ